MADDLHVDGGAWPAISDYAVIGDGRTAALVSRHGGVDWLCLPDFDSPSLLAALLDREQGGTLRVAAGKGPAASRRYLPGTNVLESRFRSDQGVLQVTDFFAVADPSDQVIQPERELVRILEAQEGEPEVEILFAPAPDYARADAILQDRGKGGWCVEGPTGQSRLRCDIPLRREGRRLRGRARLRSGERRFLSLSHTSRDPAVLPGLGAEAEGKLARTCAWWRDWSGRTSYDGPFREAVLRSLLALKALQSCLSGAVIAAATTSLPEAIPGDRNWDYRFCWLRDAAFTLRAFQDTGHDDEAAAFFGWLMHASRSVRPRLKPLYDIYGRTRLQERDLPHLSGYRGQRPVRVGNAAAGQLQLGIYGDVVGAASLFLERGNTLDATQKRLLRRLGNAVCVLWRRPDAGMWEIRGHPRHTTFSKTMCWTVLDELLKLAERGVLRVPERRFAREREAIARAIMERGYDAAQSSFTGAFDEGFMDASLLLLPRYHFAEADDPRMQGTWKRIRDRLEEPGCLMRRYEEGVDGQQGSEGGFVICSFWAVEFLARCGRTAEARERMTALLGHCNDLGLLAEEIAPGSSAMLGNFPQAFSHTGLISAALAIAEAEAAPHAGPGP